MPDKPVPGTQFVRFAFVAWRGAPGRYLATSFNLTLGQEDGLTSTNTSPLQPPSLRDSFSFRFDILCQYASSLLQQLSSLYRYIPRLLYVRHISSTWCNAYDELCYFCVDSTAVQGLILIVLREGALSR